MIILKDDRVVSRSRNLRGILDYHTKVGVKNAVAWESDKSLEVEFYDGAYTRVEFADFSVLVSWLMARRSWNGRSVKYIDGREKRLE